MGNPVAHGGGVDDQGVGVDDATLVQCLRWLLASVDLAKTSTGALRLRLEAELGVDLSDKKDLIRWQMNEYIDENLHLLELSGSESEGGYRGGRLGVDSDGGEGNAEEIEGEGGEEGLEEEAAGDGIDREYYLRGGDDGFLSAEEEEWDGEDSGGGGGEEDEEGGNGSMEGFDGSPAVPLLSEWKKLFRHVPRFFQVDASKRLMRLQVNTATHTTVFVASRKKTGQRRDAGGGSQRQGAASGSQKGPASQSPNAQGSPGGGTGSKEGPFGWPPRNRGACASATLSGHDADVTITDDSEDRGGQMDVSRVTRGGGDRREKGTLTRRPLRNRDGSSRWHSVDARGMRDMWLETYALSVRHVAMRDVSLLRHGGYVLAARTLAVWAGPGGDANEGLIEGVGGGPTSGRDEGGGPSGPSGKAGRAVEGGEAGEGAPDGAGGMLTTRGFTSARAQVISPLWEDDDERAAIHDLAVADCASLQRYGALGRELAASTIGPQKARPRSERAPRVYRSIRGPALPPVSSSGGSVEALPKKQKVRSLPAPGSASVGARVAAVGSSSGKASQRIHGAWGSLSKKEGKRVEGAEGISQRESRGEPVGSTRRALPRSTGASSPPQQVHAKLAGSDRSHFSPGGSVRSDQGGWSLEKGGHKGGPLGGPSGGAAVTAGKLVSAQGGSKSDVGAGTAQGGKPAGWAGMAHGGKSVGEANPSPGKPGRKRKVAGKPGARGELGAPSVKRRKHGEVYAAQIGSLGKGRVSMDGDVVFPEEPVAGPPAPQLPAPAPEDWAAFVRWQPCYYLLNKSKTLASLQVAVNPDYLNRHNMSKRPVYWPDGGIMWVPLNASGMRDLWLSLYALSVRQRRWAYVMWDRHPGLQLAARALRAWTRGTAGSNKDSVERMLEREADIRSEILDMAVKDAARADRCKIPGFARPSTSIFGSNGKGGGADGPSAVEKVAEMGAAGKRLQGGDVEVHGGAAKERGKGEGGAGQGLAREGREGGGAVGGVGDGPGAGRQALKQQPRDEKRRKSLAGHAPPPSPPLSDWQALLSHVPTLYVLDETGTWLTLELPSYEPAPAANKDGRKKAPTPEITPLPRPLPQTHIVEGGGGAVAASATPASLRVQAVGLSGKQRTASVSLLPPSSKSPGCGNPTTVTDAREPATGGALFGPKSSGPLASASPVDQLTQAGHSTQPSPTGQQGKSSQKACRPSHASPSEQPQGAVIVNSGALGQLSSGPPCAGIDRRLKGEDEGEVEGRKRPREGDGGKGGGKGTGVALPPPEQQECLKGNKQRLLLSGVSLPGDATDGAVELGRAAPMASAGWALYPADRSLYPLVRPLFTAEGDQLWVTANGSGLQEAWLAMYALSVQEKRWRATEVVQHPGYALAARTIRAWVPHLGGESARAVRHLWQSVEDKAAVVAAAWEDCAAADQEGNDGDERGEVGGMGLGEAVGFRSGSGGDMGGARGMPGQREEGGSARGAGATSGVGARPGAQGKAQKDGQKTSEGKPGKKAKIETAAPAVDTPSRPTRAHLASPTSKQTMADHKNNFGAVAPGPTRGVATQGASSAAATHGPPVASLSMGTAETTNKTATFASATINKSRTGNANAGSSSNNKNKTSASNNDTNNSHNNDVSGRISDGFGIPPLSSWEPFLTQVPRWLAFYKTNAHLARLQVPLSQHQRREGLSICPLVRPDGSPVLVRPDAAGMRHVWLLAFALTVRDPRWQATAMVQHEGYMLAARTYAGWARGAQVSPADAALGLWMDAGDRARLLRAAVTEGAPATVTFDPTSPPPSLPPLDHWRPLLHHRPTYIAWTRNVAARRMILNAPAPPVPPPKKPFVVPLRDADGSHRSFKYDSRGLRAMWVCAYVHSVRDHAWRLSRMVAHPAYALAAKSIRAWAWAWGAQARLLTPSHDSRTQGQAGLTTPSSRSAVQGISSSLAPAVVTSTASAIVTHAPSSAAAAAAHGHDGAAPGGGPEAGRAGNLKRAREGVSNGGGIGAGGDVHVLTVSNLRAEEIEELLDGAQVLEEECPDPLEIDAVMRMAVADAALLDAGQALWVPEGDEGGDAGEEQEGEVVQGEEGVTRAARMRVVRAAATWSEPTHVE
eukprot:jgi/Mesvir1/25996/Mv20963-RA.2